MKKFIARTKDSQDLKSKKNTFKKYLSQNNIVLFKKLHKLTKSKLNKLRSFCYNLNFGVSLRMMRREKCSNDYGAVLLKRRSI
jgi:hypothetical protein